MGNIFSSKSNFSFIEQLQTQSFNSPTRRCPYEGKESQIEKKLRKRTEFYPTSIYANVTFKSTGLEQHLGSAPPTTVWPNWEAKTYDDVAL